jgi:hypothetical protein
METLYLVADESGAKQRAIKGEQYPGELGVMAGLLFIGGKFARVEGRLNSVVTSYVGSSPKLHITDLTPGAQSSLRADIFAILKDESVTCVYEAISSHGFHKADSDIRQLEEESKQEARSSVSVSGKYPIDRLHRQLFEGLYAKTVAYGLEKLGGVFEIKAIIDHVDEALLREFRETTADFLGRIDTTTDVSGFDHNTRKVVYGKIDFRATGLDDLSQVTSSVAIGGGSLVLAADVLANSLLHHLEGRPIMERPNRPAATEGHPLQELFYGTSDNDISDALFGVAESLENDEGEDA